MTQQAWERSSFGVKKCFYLWAEERGLWEPEMVVSDSPGNAFKLRTLLWDLSGPEAHQHHAAHPHPHFY